MLDSEDSATDPGDLPLSRFLTYRLARLQARLNAQATRYLAKHADISLTDWRVIVLINDRGDTTLTRLTRDSGLDKGQISRKLKSLVSRGLIDSHQDDQDHRVQHLSLTTAGRSIVDQMLPLMQARQKHLSNALTAEELSSLLRAIDKLEDAAAATEFEP